MELLDALEKYETYKTETKIIIEKSEKEYKAVQEERDNLKKYNENLREFVDKYPINKEELERHKTNSENLAKQVLRQASDNTKLIDEKNKLQTEVSTFKNMVSLLRSENNKLEEELKTVKSEITSLSNNIIKLYDCQAVGTFPKPCGTCLRCLKEHSEKDHTRISIEWGNQKRTIMERDKRLDIREKRIQMLEEDLRICKRIEHVLVLALGDIANTNFVNYVKNWIAGEGRTKKKIADEALEIRDSIMGERINK